MPSQHLTYSALQYDDEIRILDLLPRSDAGTIRCNLRHVRLSEKPFYGAVSYVWGDPADTLPIVCNGCILRITRNLHAFLEHLQIDDGVVKIWADAICINQADLQERGSQVQMMGTIYSNADLVVAWLGEGSPESDMALELVDRLRVVDWSQEDAFENNSIELPDANNKVWIYLSELLQREYFHRAWVVQELAMAKECECMCGTLTIPFAAIILAAWYMVRTTNLFISTNSVPKLLLNITPTQSNVYDSDIRTVLAVLQRHDSAIATEPRDHLYAFYGIFAECTRFLNLRVDYTASVRSIFTEFATALLKNTRSLDMFSYPKSKVVRHATFAGLPSWVPHWTLDSPLSPLISFESENVEGFCASKSSQYCPCFGSDDGRCRLEGYSVNTVTVISFVDFRQDEIRWDPIATWHRLISNGVSLLKAMHARDAAIKRVLPARSSSLRPSGCSVDEILLRTLSCASSGDILHAAMQAYRQDDRSLWHARLLRPLDPYLPVYFLLSWAFILWQLIRYYATREFPNTINNTFAAQYDKSHGRQLFRTEGGFVGVGPPSAAVGDQIFLCKGGKLPLVLRQMAGDWEVVGDSYIFGMVNGELWEESTCQKIWLA